VLVDLTRTPELIRKGLDQKWRNQLNRSEKNGLEIDISDSNQSYDQFIRLYDGMMARKQFETTVDVQEFRSIQEQLAPRDRMQIFVATFEKEPIGALVCSLLGEQAIYLLGATNEKARDLKAAYLLQWRAMMWFKEHGAKSYDLGGIDEIKNPGGYHFKTGFGGVEAIQIPMRSYGGSAMSRAVLSGVTWYRRRKARIADAKSAATPVAAPSVPAAS
jgi:lipid II:glycine glycyltransferase (peptidoglycan interpeptide bridge formation enzyme)